MYPQFNQPKGSTTFETNKESIARRFGCKRSEVVYAKPGQSLSGYKVIFDKVSERAYSLPPNLGAATITSITDGVLVHSGGTVDLGALAILRGEYTNLTENFSTGFIIRVKNEVVTDGQSLYRWAGTLPKEVVAGSEVSTTGGISNTTWIPLDAFIATGTTRYVSSKERAGRYLNAADYLQFTTNISAAVNAAIANIRSEANPTYPDSAGGIIRIPRGRSVATTPITIDMIPGVGGLGISLEGEGTAATFIDFGGADVDGLVGNASAGPLYGHIQDITFANARSALRLLKGSRLRIHGIEAYVPSSDGFNMQNLIMTEVSNSFVSSGKSHGFNYTGDPSSSTSQEKTSIFHHNNWVRKTVGHGHILGNMSYSLSACNGVDDGGAAGYYITGVSYGLTSLNDGAESCQQSGWLIEATRSTDDVRNFRIAGGYGRNNNRAGGNASMIGVKAANGGKAVVIIDGVVNKPQAGASAGECVIVNGDGAIARLHGNSDLPNGFKSINSGYIDYTPVGFVVNKSIPLASSGVGICSLKSSQGYGLRFAGEMTIVARDTHPSNGSGRIAIYKLLICRSDFDSNYVTVITSAGYKSSAGGSGDKSAWPAFNFTLDPATNILSAVPQTSVGGVAFYFEIETSKTLVATAV